jgi:hypothetical protein
MTSMCHSKVVNLSIAHTRTSVYVKQLLGLCLASIHLSCPDSQEQVSGLLYLLYIRPEETSLYFTL